jgi:phosphoribosylformylglycinamidine (FGAM) synthase PurS component
MLREDIPDAQGAAITATLRGLGFEGFTVRQGKRFEVDVDGELTQERLDQLRQATEDLLVNIEVEDYEISLVGEFDDDHEGHDHDHDDDHEGHDHEGHDHEGHDHEGHDDDHEDHDHEGHDHDHDDDHGGHDHEGHDHEGHDHDHDDDHEGHDHGADGEESAVDQSQDELAMETWDAEGTGGWGE